MNKEMVLLVKKLRIYAILMRIVELKKEKYAEIILVKKPELAAIKPIVFTVSDFPKLEYYKPSKMQLEQLPQKVKHWKKIKFHN
jgi:hypothetical protein